MSIILDSASWGIVVILIQVIVINLVMSGDNALMISMTTQGLSKYDRKKAVFFGVLGATIMRVIFAFGVAQLLDVYRVKILGSLFLFGIAAKLYKQFRERDTSKKQHTTSTTWGHALWMIIIADVSMSLDNVLAVASVSSDHPIILIVGILVSIILMTTIATVIAKLLDRFPWIEWLGFAMIMFLGFKMLFAGVETIGFAVLKTIFYRVVAMLTIFVSIYLHRKYMTSFEAHEVTAFLYNHAPFIITVLLLIIVAFLMHGVVISLWLFDHQALWFTILTCIFLLALEMASLERVKHKVKL